METRETIPFRAMPGDPDREASSLHVTVVDADGRGVPRVPIAIEPTWISARGPVGRAELARTDHQGRAILTRIEDRLGRWTRYEGLRRVTLVADVCAAQPPSFRLDPARLPEAVRLRVAPLGRIRVRVTDREGVAFAHDTIVELRPHGCEQPIWRGLAGAAGARFDRVACGTSYRATTVYRGELLERTFAGPTVSGQEVAIDLALAGRRAVVTGRLLDTNGAPLRERSVTLRFRSRTDELPFDATHRREVQPDARGLFRAVLGPVPEGTALDLYFELGGRPMRSATVTKTLGGDDLELGDVALR